MWGNSPFFCTLPNKTNCPLSILHWANGLVFHDGIVRQTVFQHKGGYPQTIQPFSDLRTFVFDSNPPVGSTRTNYYSSTCCLSCRSRIHIETGIGYVPHLYPVIRRIDTLLEFVIANSSGNFSIPKVN